MLQLRGALLNRRQPLRPEQEVNQLAVTDLAAGAQDLDQLFDEAGEFLAGDVVVGPAEIAVPMKDLRNLLLQHLAPVIRVFSFIVQVSLPGSRIFARSPSLDRFLRGNHLLIFSPSN